jgi:murein DD-endopeptidase MepM/ murein hydrolase activator NlpD
MGRVARCAALLLAAALAAGAVAGCASGPKKGRGGWYEVRRGDTLWKLSQRYDVSVAAIERANEGIDARALRVGQRLRIPARGADERGVAAGPPFETLERREPGPCAEHARSDLLAFDWPVLGHVSSAFGERGRRGHDGIDLAAEEGTPVRAAESGRVVYADDELADYGKVVIVKHAGRWATVYAHNRKNLVDEGEFVEKGDVIAEVGDTGNASAPHLHFEVRRANAAHDPQSCLP